MTTFRALAIAVLLVVLVYGGSYVWLSARGRYEPAVIGLYGVKSYSWAPKGFVRENFQYDMRFHRAYYPLWQLDERFWHPPIRRPSETDRPISVVPDDEVGRLYEAWGLTQ